MSQPTNPTPEPVRITAALLAGLTGAAADGMACVRCNLPTTTPGRAFRPVGRSASGSQVFACTPACPTPEPAADPADTVMLGDPDPNQHEEPCCKSERGGWLCTRTRDHTGQHVAGDLHEVCAVWTNEDTAPEQTSPTVTLHAGRDITVTLPAPGGPARLTAEQALHLTVLLVAATGYATPVMPPPMTDAELDEAADAAHDEWLTDRVAEEVAAHMRRSVRDGARSALDHCLAGPPSMGDHGLAVWYAKAAGRLIGAVRELLAELDKVAPEDPTPAEPVPADVDQPDAHALMVFGDAMGRLATVLMDGGVAAQKVRDALASGSPEQANTASEWISQTVGMHIGGLLQQHPVDREQIDQIHADVDVVTAVLYNAAGWKSL